MKNYKLILLAAVASCAFSACAGDHATSNGVDSVKDNYNYYASKNLDTSAVTHTMGEATVTESAGSGGVLVAKDTTHMKVRSVTIAPSAPVVAPAAAPAKADSAATAKK